MSCGEKFLYLSKKVTSGSLLAFVPSRCKSWSCPHCRPLKAQRVRDYIIENFTTEPLYMMTLTFFHSGEVLDCWKTLGQKWNRMRTYLAKKYGKFTYLRLVEPHKKGGWPHLHILVQGFTSLPKAEDRVTQWGFGWNYHCKQMPPKAAAHYVSKYLTKEWPDSDVDVLRVASKCRIVSVSRSLPAIFSVKSDWDVMQYDEPSGNAIFLCNAIINFLKEKKATFVTSKAFGGGFIIHSDIMIIPSSDLSGFPKDVWKYCDDFDYEHIPYGLQQKLKI